MADSNFDIVSKQEEAAMLAFFRKRSQVMGYLQSVRNSTMFWIGANDKPSWFDTVSSDLDALRADSQTWSDTLAPSTTVIPQNYINFADAYTGQLPVLTDLMKRLIAAKTGQNVDDLLNGITTIFDALIKESRVPTANLDALDTGLSGFLSQLGTDISALTKGAGSIKDALKAEQQQVTDIQGKIEILQNRLEADLGAIETADIFEDGALVALVIALVVVVAEPGVGTVLAVVGAGVGLGIAKVVDVISNDAVVKDQQDILAEQSELSEAAAQVLTLQGLSTTVNALLSSYSDKGFSLTDLKATWTTLELNLQSVRDLIISEHSGYPDGLQAVLNDLVNLEQTLGRLTTYCTTLQEAALTAASTPVQTLTIPKAQAA